VDELARQVEILAGGLRAGDKSRKYGSLGRNGTVGRADAVAVEEETFIDVVAISHEFTDHCHKDTLLEVSKDVPVLATEVCLPTSFTYQQDL
jgi:L-ascorbate metabolism protein UlaG (beta-lactamase superfamily)